MKIIIVGKGVFGKAIYYILRKNTQDVFFAKRDNSIDSPEIVVLCVPTQSIRDVLPLITFSKRKKIIVNTAKGIERTTHKFPYQIIEDVFGDNVEYYSLMGPSFAHEMLKDMPTLVNIGYRSGNRNARTVKKLFQTDMFRVRLTEGVEILEIASAMKNVYAIGCGLADGLGYGENTKAKLLVLAIEEIQKLFLSLNLQVHAGATAGTIGDLILTCTSRESRNFRFGKYLVNSSTDEALQKVHSTVEGYTSLDSLARLARYAKISLPLASFISQIVISKDKNKQEQFMSFMKKT